MSLSTTTDFDETSTTSAEFDAQKIVLANSSVLSADVNVLVEKALRRTKYLDNIKVDIAGDTMTGKLIIAPSTTVQGLQVSAGTGSNQNAIQATGDGTGPAIIGTGGANAAGASFTAGGGNNFGGRGIGSGNEVGWEATGGTTGPGMRATPGTVATTTAPTYAFDAVSGGLRMTTVAAPNASVDPGADATMFPQNMISSTAIVESDGAGNYTVRNNKGLNIASFSGNASGVGTITFVRTLLGNDYRMHIDAMDGFAAKWNGVQNTTGFQFQVRNTAGTATDLTNTAVTISVTTVGF